MKQNNVIIFIVDSVRHYSTGGLDDRDKLKMMDSFEKESIYFPLAITTAPSSIMSLSSLITSLPAYYIARNYDDFKYDSDKFVSLHQILKDNGYNVFSLFNARELRFFFGEPLNQIHNKYWADGLKNSQLNWSNENMNKSLKNFLSKGTVQEPFFLLVWYNVRKDPNTSEHISDGIQLLKEYNFWDNSVFLLGSDHGYMDPRRGFTPEKLQEQGLSHDLLMTDDNIRIPLYLRYPNCPIKKVESAVSNLDIMPTILSLLNIDYPKNTDYKMYGKNLIPLVNDDADAMEYFAKRKVRSDARFFAQSDRSTAIRDQRYKYVIRPDKNQEEFFDVMSDSMEENNLINNSKYYEKINEFKEFYKNSENEIIEFQFNYLLNKMKQSMVNAADKENILLVGTAEPYFLQIIGPIIKNTFTKVKEIDVLLNKNRIEKFEINELFDKVIYYSIIDNNIELIPTLNWKKYDITIFLFDTRNAEKINSEHKLLNPLIKSSAQITINPNMEFVKREKALLNIDLILNVLKQKRSYYFRHPNMLFHHFLKWLKIIKQ